MTNIVIEKLQLKDLAEIYSFVLQCRSSLFPMLDDKPLPIDLERFKEFYIDDPKSSFLIARTKEGTLIGTIGMREYDRRFEVLKYGEQKIVEVTRLFVQTEYRRHGLGTTLFNELYTVAKNKGIEIMYLHTHPFLPGAQVFWEKQLFHLIKQTVEAGFVTLHMDLSI
ncbi:GNAT family N-acetyltransferase [Myroides guanonis]|uniref:N-acetylglutamate synthase, GNAT family n=1 Tax=Myroides guanonis TaxID=1150112 RepID=A0A1I3U018_9FLAO|nr:GNAT family N-acetyltransferase [Myroides guanonis]SFJ75246.1 N-acetylglutamate synthase, GNAT family [Myroides guanonis]